MLYDYLIENYKAYEPIFTFVTSKAEGASRCRKALPI